MGRWLLNNVGTLALAVLLAILVWVVALNEENPIEEKAFPELLSVELLNTPDGLIRVGSVLTQTTATLRAPQSVWRNLNANDIRITADLAGLAPGTHSVPLQAEVDSPAAQVISLNPASIAVTLEEQATREKEVRVVQGGEPALGYEAGDPVLSSTTVTITGPASAVDRVSEVLVSITVAGLRRDLNTDAVPVPVDTMGKSVSNVTLNPGIIQVTIPVTQKQGYRDVAVSPVITGQVASGYRITSINVTPLVVTLTSGDPTKVNNLPGFVETEPLDLSGAEDDITVRLNLALPEGVTLVGEQSIQVQIFIAAIEGSVTVPRPLEFVNLSPGLSATSSPETVDVLISGPVPVLERLRQEDVHVTVDLTGREPGTYQLTPIVSLLPARLRALSVLPSQIEVIIIVGLPATRTPTITLTPTATRTTPPTARPTFTFTPMPPPTETETPTPSP